MANTLSLVRPPRLESLPTGGVWQTLEQLLDFVPGEGPLPLPIWRVLREARECLGADVVYFFPGLSGEAFELEGEPALPASWCERFTLRLLEESPGDEGELLRNSLEGRGQAHRPQSAVLARLSETHSSWLVALSFRTERLFRPADMRLLALFRKLALANREQARAREQWQATLLGLVRCLVTAIDGRDPYTVGRSERVGRIAARLGQEMELPSGVRGDLYLVGLMHGIGRVGERGEAEDAGTHPVEGDRILATIPTMAHLRPGVRHQAEHYDGSGRPDGLAGVDIPLTARVLAVACECDAQMSPRPGREPLAPSELETHFAAGAGRSWDPVVVDAFVACSHELYAIRQRGIGESVLKALDRPDGGMNRGGGTPLC